MKKILFCTLAAAMLVSIVAQASVTDVIAQVLTGHFYASDGARINRMGDRLFVGGAVAANGNEATAGDWLSGTFDFGWVMRDPVFASLTEPGSRIAATFGARASDSPGNAGAGVQTVVSMAVNNVTGGAAWALYGDATAFPGAMLTYGAELDVRNFASTVSGNPYNIAAVSGQTIDLWLASGGTMTGAPGAAHNNTAAIGVGYNGATFQSGLVFSANALAGNNGTTGYAEAIALPKGDTINWYAPNGVAAQSVVSAISNPANGGQLIFTDYGPIFLRKGAQMAQFLTPSNNDAAILLAVNRGGVTTMSWVHIGAVNSGGSGRRCLTVDN